jgi:dTDP-4-amino-4,6-dideoxygalactose transaminase
LPIEVPQVRNQDHVWHLFVIRTPQRDALQRHLAARRIECGLHYPMPNHRQPCLRHLACDPADFPQTERWATQGLSLPLFFGMQDEQVDAVSDAVRDFFARG